MAWEFGGRGEGGSQKLLGWRNPRWPAMRDTAMQKLRNSLGEEAFRSGAWSEEALNGGGWSRRRMPSQWSGPAESPAKLLNIFEK